MNQNRKKTSDCISHDRHDSHNFWSPGCYPSALHAVLGDGARHVLQDQVGLPMAQLENFKRQPTWEKTKTKGHKDDTTQLLLYVIAICGLLYRFQVSVSAWTFDVFSHVKDSLPATIKICLRPSLHLNLDSLKPHAHGGSEGGQVKSPLPTLATSSIPFFTPVILRKRLCSLPSQQHYLAQWGESGPPFLSACWNCETSPDQALQFSTKYK